MYTSEHWLLPWRLRKCLELLEEMQSNRLIPLRVQLHFEVAHCEANPWNFEFVHSTFNQIFAIGCCAIAWNWYSTTLNNRTRFTWFTHWEVFFQTTLRILSPDGWSALIGQVASDLLTKGCGEFERANTLDYTVTEAELLDTAPWWKTLDGKQRELKYGLIWCWYRLWMDGLNGMLRNWLLRNSSLNINKIISLASFAIQQEQYCYIWHHSNMFETNKCNKMIQDVQKHLTQSSKFEVRPLLSEDVGPLGRDPAHYLRRFDEATEDSTGGFTEELFPCFTVSQQKKILSLGTDFVCLKAFN